ncbi:ATP-binding response regulator [Coleofasciculus sp. F4-SAH-05]|uniref:ATP-binding response regulator n=1 Tax=Coleofasciculus sp. F4-SAH-05 TaxID=3069525 RepID=UPI0032F99AD3
MSSSLPQILLVDDTVANLQLVSDCLMKAGFNVLAVKSGVQALKIVAITSPDLILLDVVMPEMDGFEVCRRLKAQEETQDIPVIFMTAVADRGNPSYKIKGLKLGAVDYISKPIQLEEVLLRVKTHLQLRALTQQLTEQNTCLQQEIRVRHQTQQILQETERRWRSLLENVQLLVVGLDWQGNVEYINPFGLGLTGYTQAEAVGKNWFTLFIPPSDQPQLKQVFHELLYHNSHAYYQNSILTKSGEERLIAWNNTVLRDITGAIAGTMSIGEDITQRQAVERMKNEFISLVSHELRTPLTSMRGSLGLLKMGVYDNQPDKAKQMLDIAAGDCDRLGRLVNDILSLERLDSGQVTLVKEVCNVADLIKHSVEAIDAIAAAAEISIQVTPLSAQVYVAPDAIIQTLTNLLSNAIKFSESNTTITVGVQHQSDCILFQVTDQGRGIPTEHLERIFGRFQQVDVSDSRQKGGTGLGLAICRSIIQQHGGEIWAESTLGSGSTFYFTLPVYKESVQ